MLQGVKNLKKVVFLGSTWNRLAHKSVDRDRKTVFSDHQAIFGTFAYFNGFFSP